MQIQAQARANAKDYSPLHLPLEALVEREPVRRLGQNNSRLAAEAGLHLLRILDAEGVGTYRPLYRKAYSLKTPAEDIRQGLDDDTLRFLEVVAGRTVDGLQLYAKLAELRKSAGAGSTVHRVTF